jgi:hypothetical protein
LPKGIANTDILRPLMDIDELGSKKIISTSTNVKVRAKRARRKTDIGTIYKAKGIKV